jgi:enterochelin esterase-like enzyme
VYLPPGYGTGSRRYPVIYEVPWAFGTWQAPTHLTGLLDQLIDSGAIPPEIVVFVAQTGGPYPDSECVNSADGREWFERWFTNTVVVAIDHHFATIATPAARATLGFSQGGYCAPMLLLRHPDVVWSAISFSGYFQSAIKGPQTPNAWRPFGNDATLISETSPLNAVGFVPESLRPSLFVVLASDPNEAFYGPQYQAFAAALSRAGIAAALMPNTGGHNWTMIREALPGALATLAARQVVLGVFHG